MIGKTKFIDVYYEGLLSGISDGKKISDIAKKHGVKYNDIVKQLRKGRKVEMEHTKNKDIAMGIAMDHLMEDPKYYDKLETIEEGVYSSLEGWISPNGLYMPVKEGESGHYDALRRILDTKDYNVAFKQGWQRVVSIGDTVYSNNPIIAPNKNQRAKLKQIAIENQKHQVVWDNDEDEKVIWRE